MANIASAKKRIRQNQKRRAHNQALRARTRSSIKHARESVESGELEAQQEALHKAVIELDKAAAAHAIHPKNAARRKSRLMKQLAGKGHKE